MPMITALTTQKKHKDRVNVFLDGAFAFGLPFAVAARLKIGQTLVESEIEALQRENTLDKVKNTAVRLISYRPRSITEVRRHLDRKGYEAELIEAVIDQLQMVELLDDTAFARFWVEQRETFKPRSRMALQQELRQKGVSREVIKTALTDLNEMDAARRAATAKTRSWTQLPEPDFRKKLGGFLQRRGFHYGIIKEITDELWQAIVADADNSNPTHEGD